jgi:hypothetical protein
MRARSVWLAGITAVGVLLGGCANEDAPATLPVVSKSASGSSERNTASTPLHTVSPEGVEAEIRAFYEEYARVADESLVSRDALEETRQFFAESCVSCMAGYEIADGVLDAGHIIEADPVRVIAVEIDAIQGDSVIFRGVLDVPATTVRDHSGRIVEEFPATPNVTTVYTAMRQPDGSWVIVTDQVLG